MEEDIPSVIRLLERAAKDSAEALEVHGLEDEFQYKLPTLDEPLDGKDLSEDTLGFVKDLCRTMDMLKKVEVMEAQKESKMSPVTGQKE